MRRFVALAMLIIASIACNLPIEGAQPTEPPSTEPPATATATEIPATPTPDPNRAGAERRDRQ